MTRAKIADAEQDEAPRTSLAAELAEEFYRRSGLISALPLDFVRWVRDQGVAVAGAENVRNVAGPISEHDIFVLKDRFEFAPEGAAGSVRAVVHLVYSDDAETPCDLCAWTRGQPQRVFLALGAAEGLGIDQVGSPASWFLGKPLRVHRRPLDWLKGNCCGIVIFEPACIRAKLACLEPRREGYSLASESLEHGRQLRRMLRPLPVGVKILVPTTRQQGNVA